MILQGLFSPEGLLTETTYERLALATFVFLVVIERCAVFVSFVTILTAEESIVSYYKIITSIYYIYTWPQKMEKKYPSLEMVWRSTVNEERLLYPDTMEIHFSQTSAKLIKIQLKIVRNVICWLTSKQSNYFLHTWAKYKHMQQLLINHIMRTIFSQDHRHKPNSRLRERYFSFLFD